MKVWLALDALPCVWFLQQFFRHPVIAILNISTMTYQLGPSQLDNGDYYTVLSDSSCGALIQQKGENDGDFFYLLSTVSARIKPRFFSPTRCGLRVNLFHKLTELVPQCVFPFSFVFEVYLVSFHI